MGAVLTAAALAITVAGAAAPSASAAGGCWQSGGRWWCNNVSGAPVYGTMGASTQYPDPSRVVGYMNSNPSWFFCKMDGQNWVGGPHPTRWEFTVADNGEYGWMKDTAISSETNPLPNC
ncbi:hypothetical protein [Streptomyces sp. NBC_01361]|uniref:hypothetical protein n=1 Tax=Streptomyces sp. NBC_01361 TaxID=2903838 RepID=UPI002E2F43BC|nr:hypothetical protein [Streptomyces sp. NBC_01361]